eukprot:14925754-Alexandrium_andersonii.AAC.1
MAGPRARLGSMGPARTCCALTVGPQGAGPRARAPPPQGPGQKLARRQFRRCCGPTWWAPATKPNG